MMMFFMVVVVAPAVVLAVPTIVLLAEVCAALLAGKPDEEIAVRAKPVAVVVPAHNESVGLLPTLDDLISQQRPGDRIVVVADNCSDDTAAIAASRGVEVIVRRDPDNVGKGFALSTGLDHLAADPPHYVLFCDADCRLQADLIDRLAATCARTGRPVQACYLMHRPADAATSRGFAEFAWLLKNMVRPLGLRAMRGPCQLMGTGMMFPWPVIRSVPLASGNIVEDLQLGLDLAEQGHPPIFAYSARTTSEFPTREAGSVAQRKRWIQGHLGTILRQTPRLLLAGLRLRDLNLLALGLDLAVLPIVLFAALSLATLVLAGGGWLAGLPAVVVVPALLQVTLLATAIVVAWLRFGQGALPPAALWRAGPELWSKFGVYLDLLRGRKADRWIRTDRRRPD